MKKHLLLVLSLTSVAMLSSCIGSKKDSSSAKEENSSQISNDSSSESTADSSSDASKEASSESASSSSSQSSSSSKSDGEWNTNYSDDNVDYNYVANKNVGLTDIDINTPSVGTQPVLVVPVTFTDKTFTNTELEEIKTLCGGEAKDTSYWESLGSFYEKSSYGKLKLEFTYSDPVSMGVTARSFYNSYGKKSSDSNQGKPAAVALKKSIAAYKSAHGNDSTKKFDTDGDGYIDSVIMIYAEEFTPSYDYTSTYWAYRFWDVYDSNYNYDGSFPDGNTSSPVGCSYFWASLNFFYDGTGTRNNHSGIDAHTLIHEFGHMLGADDYYNSDENPTKEVTGGKIMMAYNVLDHDAFNKLQYNWVTPHYVHGSAEVTISSFESSGDCILIADPNGWNGTAFDEYVLIELFTPTGLNELDSKNVYPGRDSMGETGYDKAGVRMWHVDNRLAKVTVKNDQYSYSYFNDSDVTKGNINGSNYYPVIACVNGEDRDTDVCYGKGYDALSLISAKGTSFTTSTYSSDDDLFHKGDEFSLIDSKVASKYTKYFADSNHFNNGNKLNYKVEVTSLSDTEATIRITEHN